jgi:GNAT superfamily N-acetyltransferase
MTAFTIRDLVLADCPVISAAFEGQGWKKPVSQYERYFREKDEGMRDVLVAFSAGEFAGYTTINYQSGYASFSEQGVPEISDLNVLEKYQRRGLATLLIQEAERRILPRSPVAGIGVGLFANYGPAQRLYCKLGYAPDGKGVTSKGLRAQYGDAVSVDDELVLWMTKRL